MRDIPSENDLIAILRREGPLTGAELMEQTRADPLPLWQLTRRSPAILSTKVGRRYLRLDRAVEGYARLSPSIRREFLTYTLLGLAGDDERIAERASELAAETERISRLKFDLARETMESVLEHLPDAAAVRDAACFLIAGDVTYGMSHDVPRPETSTGMMVRGSDLDIVVVATDELPDEALKAVDEAVYRKKHYLLVHPAHREEIDYVVKRLSKVREQLQFDGLRSMIACKILCEGEFLAGSREVFDAVKALVEEHGIGARLAELEAHAAAAREAAEISLLDPTCDTPERDCLHLFYTSEEGDEIA